MVRLFRSVCQPLATPDTHDAFLFGLRLMAIDGTVEDVAEPFLVRQGFLMRTPRGRVATARAWEHLGHRPPASTLDLFSVE